MDALVSPTNAFAFGSTFREFKRRKLRQLLPPRLAEFQDWTGARRKNDSFAGSRRPLFEADAAKPDMRSFPPSPRAIQQNALGRI
jgi:hypothetical protein